MVMDVNGVATEELTTWNLERRAQDLGGEYIVAGTG
jgi:hypothetical protein